MKKMDLLDALGSLDEKYVREADARADALKSQNNTPIEMLKNAEEEPQSSGFRRPQWLRVMTGVAAAAVFALTVGTVGKVILNARRGPAVKPGSSVAGSDIVSTQPDNLFGGKGTVRMLNNYTFEDDTALYLKDQKIDKKTGEVSPFLLSYGEGLLFTDGAGICRIDSSRVIHRVNSDGTEETLLDLNTLLENVTVRFDPEMDVFYKVGENRWFLSFGATENLPDRIGQRVACWIDIPTPGEIGHVTFYNGSDALTLQENPFRFETSVSLTRTDKPDLYLFKGRTPSDGLVFDTVALFSNEGDGSLSTFFGNVSTLELYNVAYSGGYYFYTEMVNTPDDSHVHINLSRKPVDNTLQEGELLWDDCGFRQFSMKNGKIYTVDYSKTNEGELISLNPDGSDRTVLASGFGPNLYDFCFTETEDGFGGQFMVLTENEIVFCKPESGEIRRFACNIGSPAVTDTQDDKQTDAQTTETTAVQNEMTDKPIANTLQKYTEYLFEGEPEYRKEISYSNDANPISGTIFADMIGCTPTGCVLEVCLPEENKRESVRTTGEFMLCKYADLTGKTFDDSPVLKPAADRPANEKTQITVTKQVQTMTLNWKESIGALDSDSFYALSIQIEDKNGAKDWVTVNLPLVLGTDRPVPATLISQSENELLLTVRKDALKDKSGSEIAYVDQAYTQADNGIITFGPLYEEPSGKNVKIQYEDHITIDSMNAAVVQFYYPDLTEKVADDEMLIVVRWTNHIREYTPNKGTHYLTTSVFYDNGLAQNESMTARDYKKYYDQMRLGTDSFNEKYIKNGNNLETAHFCLVFEIK